MNLNLLKGKIVENGYTLSSLREELGISSTAITRKMQGKSEFKLSEVNKIKTLLNISNEETIKIFLD